LYFKTEQDLGESEEREIHPPFFSGGKLKQSVVSGLPFKGMLVSHDETSYPRAFSNF